jgi:hypothetical protein
VGPDGRCRVLDVGAHDLAAPADSDRKGLRDGTRGIEGGEPATCVAQVGAHGEVVVADEPAAIIDVVAQQSPAIAPGTSTVVNSPPPDTKPL